MKAKIIKLKQVDSTNLFCKRYAQTHPDRDIIVTAKTQTGGLGTKGRSFSSGKGGLYVSVMRRYPDFDFSQAFSIMINACVVVCRTLEELGLSPRIRWANDVLIGDRKICGTLIENTLLQNDACLSIVGMGINVNNALPQELKDIAISVKEVTGKKVKVSKVLSLLIKNTQNEYTVSDYKRFVDWLGQEVVLICGEKKFTALAVDIDDDGSLLCKCGGELKKINSAEMSLRLG